MARFPVSFGSCRVSVAAALFVAATAAGRTVAAHSDGVASTLFGASDTGCNQCHTDNVNTPTVVLTSSSATLTAGQQITLTFMVPTVNASPAAGGVNNAARH